MNELPRHPRSPAPFICRVEDISDPDLLVAIGIIGGSSTGYVILQLHQTDHPHLDPLAWAPTIGSLSSLLRQN